MLNAGVAGCHFDTGQTLTQLAFAYNREDLLGHLTNNADDRQLTQSNNGRQSDRSREMAFNVRFSQKYSFMQIFQDRVVKRVMSSVNLERVRHSFDEWLSDWRDRGSTRPRGALLLSTSIRSFCLGVSWLTDSLIDWLIGKLIDLQKLNNYRLPSNYDMEAVAGFGERNNVWSAYCYLHNLYKTVKLFIIYRVISYSYIVNYSIKMPALLSLKFCLSTTVFLLNNRLFPLTHQEKYMNKNLCPVLNVSLLYFVMHGQQTMSKTVNTIVRKTI